MATISWIGTSGGNWSTGANWQGGVAPGAADDAVMHLTAAETITVSTTQHVHSIAMTDTAAAFVLTNTGALDATGNISLSFGTIAIDGTIDSGGSIAIDSQTSLSLGSSSGLNAAVIQLEGGSVVPAGTATIGTATVSLGSILATSGITTLSGNGSGGISAVTVPCFAEGTHIATPEGETPVEALLPGDLVRLANDTTAPIAWIGRRHIECRRHPRPDSVRPVRVRRDAFADNLPQRDLILSPDHAIHCGKVLIPVRLLVNGHSIVQEAWDQVTYFHIELPRHDILLAEGLPVESYLETGGRDAFANGTALVRLFPEFAVRDPGFVSREWDANAAAPLVVAGPVLERVTAALRCRAQQGRGPAMVAEIATPVAGPGRLGTSMI